ncbi:NAD-binding protein, partial [Klebsiella pneumoniae]|nr:NAD-binding protein [Klebsiella pneumoniae]
EQGTLVIFAGGDAQTITELTPVYNVLSQRVTRMGDTGTGQATKICNQLIVAANSALIAEAVALADRAGVDTTLLAPA